jgi:site-specific DNA-methyltransferase (adenine-specific)
VRPVATRTRTFGAGNRESHDASDFYARFTAPELSDDTTINPCEVADSVICGDARDMHQIADNSVALVVTSPPYYAGKAYETDLKLGHVPSTYLEYLTMLRDVFAECLRVLEPGGRLCVNVANLGRKPYRSLAGDVTTILQDELAMLLRGEIIWVKAKGAAGSCAFGSYMKASNPVLRDLTERVVIASKGRFSRAIPAKERGKLGLPHESDITKDEFLASTLDVWEIRPERARRVNHPAPFPVELPERFIHLYTYVDDVVLDPFLGSGSTAVAAVRANRRFVGFDTDPEYSAIAEARIAEARAARTDSDSD